MHVAVLGAERCGPCKRLEREVLPDLQDLNLQLIDVDTEADLAAKLFCPKSKAVRNSCSSMEAAPLENPMTG